MEALDIKTVRRIREEKGLSMRALAIMAGVSPNTIFRTENGLPISKTTKVKIAKALKVSPKNIEFFIVRKRFLESPSA